MKRLFIFAGYEKREGVRDATRYCLEALHRLGDIILIMDNDGVAPREVADLCLHVEFRRHGEYDFGSYKRGYQWARQEGILQEYKFLYLVNDSVVGPLYDLGPVLVRMEKSGKDAFGLVYNPHKTKRHLQSWFIGLTSKVFLSTVFADFIGGVKRTEKKWQVCRFYEMGLTNLLIANGFTFMSLYEAKRKSIYNNARKYYRKGLPFFKRDTLFRHNGSYAGQIKYILRRTDPRLREEFERDLAAEGQSRLLTSNPFVLTSRLLSHLCHKLRKGTVWT